MAQVPPSFCPRCGTPTVAGQRFCANCGLVITVSSTDAASVPQFTPAQQYTQAPLQAPQAYSQPAREREISAPPLAQPPRKRSSGKARLILILLLLLVVLGVGGYIAAGLLGLNLPGFGSDIGGTQPPVTTSPINATLTYAGADISILTAQQSQSFVDDPNTTTTGMVRLHLQEQNKTSTQVNWVDDTLARLILPGRHTVAPTFVKGTIGVAPGVTQTSIVDFAVPSSDKISQLTLRLGASNEAQMDIPLTGKANLSKYAPKTVKPEGQLTYLGLNYTLVNATSQLSIAGQQASTGMTYIIVTLSVDNTLSQVAIPGSAYDYVRLKAGHTTATPKNTTLPVSFVTGETGKTGTVTFLMPQSSPAFTLILLPQGGTAQATTDFQFAS